jgi:hypothetical protein
MPLRRILITLLLFMIAMSFTASLTSRQGSSTTSSAPAPRAQAGLARTLVATLPHDKVVGAAVGDRIDLTVKARAPDVVVISGYDFLQAVDSLSPALFDFIADAPGSFAVTLQSTGRVLGRIEVTVRP